MKIYARQVDPEFQESPLFLFDDWDCGLCLTGNRDFKSHTTEVFDRVKCILDGGDILEYLYDGQTNLSEVFDNYLYPENRSEYNKNELKELSNLVGKYNYATIGSDNEYKILCKVLSIVTGEEWDFTVLRGCCQGDWQYFFYKKDEWTYESIKNLEYEYFNLGTDWEIYTGENEKYLDNVYTHSYCTADIKKEIAEYTGCDIYDITLFKFDGYKQIPQFSEVKEKFI